MDNGVSVASLPGVEGGAANYDMPPAPLGSQPLRSAHTSFPFSACPFPQTAGRCPTGRRWCRT